jgi:hypothetical protein
VNGTRKVKVLPLLAAGLAFVLLAVPAQGQETLDSNAKKAAADAYLSMVCPYNEASNQLGVALRKAYDKGMKRGSKLPKQLVSALERYAETAGNMGRQLSDYDWPTTQLDKDAEAIAESYYENASKAGMLVVENRERATKWTSASANSARMRLTLGLPPANVKNGGCPS